MSEKVVAILFIFHDCCESRHAVSESFKGCLCDFDVIIFEPEDDGGEYGFLERFLEKEIEVFELLADESYRQNGHFLDN